MNNLQQKYEEVSKQLISSMDNLRKTHEEVTYPNGSKVYVPKSDVADDIDVTRKLDDMNVAEWEIEFDEDFSNKGHGSFVNIEYIKVEKDNIKQFISQNFVYRPDLKEKLEERKRDFYAERNNEGWNVAYYDAICDILEALGL